MLILARRQGERVVIGGDVTVTVMEISGQTVRLGIAGPDDLPIYREEIWLAVQAENQAAAESNLDALPQPPKGAKRSPAGGAGAATGSAGAAVAGEPAPAAGASGGGPAPAHAAEGAPTTPTPTPGEPA